MNKTLSKISSKFTGLFGIILLPLAACQMHPVDTSVCGRAPTPGVWKENVEKALSEQLPVPYGNKIEPLPVGEKVKPFPANVKYDFGDPHRYIINSDKFFTRPVKEAGYTVMVKVKAQQPNTEWKEYGRFYCFFHNDIVTDCEQSTGTEPWKLTHLGIVFSDEYPKK